MESYRVVAALGALAQESRLAIFRLLVAQGPLGLPAGQIADAVGLPAATLSFHLSQLHHAGLVRSRREGRSIFYAADYDSMNELLRYLTENCCSAGGGCAPRPSGKETSRAARSRGRSK